VDVIICCNFESLGHWRVARGTSDKVLRGVGGNACLLIYIGLISYGHNNFRYKLIIYIMIVIVIVIVLLPLPA